MSRLRNPDFWLILLALVYSLPSLAYPFISDHAANYYVGYWWAEGLVPYVDTWDNKSPGIFALHAICVLLFGEGTVPIRIADALTVAATAAGITWVARQGRSGIPGELGTVTWLTVAFYYTTLTFAETAQAEIWEAGFALASFGLALRTVGRPTVMFAAGVLGGVAILFKTPAILICAGVGGLLALRLRGASDQAVGLRGVWIDFAAYVGGGVFVGALTLLYFTAAGALWDLLEWAFLFVPAYAVKYQEPEAFLEVLEIYLLSLGLWALLLPLLGAFGIWSELRAEAEPKGRPLVVWALVMVGLAFGTVVMQMSWASYHWVVLMPFFLIPVACGIRALLETRPAAVWAVHAAILFLATFGAPEWEESEEMIYSYPDHVLTVAAYASGRIDRGEYLAAFEQPSESFADEEELSRLLREEADPGDRMLVAGYHPLIHALSGLQSMDRFSHGAWEIAESPFFEDWTEERAEIFRGRPPRFVVVDLSYGDSLELLDEGDYEEWLAVEDLQVFLRNDD